jgi:hypothetical protein
MNKKEKRKKKRIKLKNKSLIKKYPFLLPKDEYTNKKIKGYDYSYTYMDDLPIGWAKAFGINLMEDIKKVLIEEHYLDKFQFEQIKEKYGTLRIYANYSSDAFEHILNKYECISENVCTYCGKPDVPLLINIGWIIPLCEPCYNKCINSTIPYDKTYEKTSNTKIPNEYKIITYYEDNKEVKTYDMASTVENIRYNYEKRKKRGRKI